MSFTADFPKAQYEATRNCRTGFIRARDDKNHDPAAKVPIQPDELWLTCLKRCGDQSSPDLQLSPANGIANKETTHHTHGPQIPPPRLRTPSNPLSSLCATFVGTTPSSQTQRHMGNAEAEMRIHGNSVPRWHLCDLGSGNADVARRLTPCLRFPCIARDRLLECRGRVGEMCVDVWRHECCISPRGGWQMRGCRFEASLM